MTTGETEHAADAEAPGEIEAATEAEPVGDGGEAAVPSGGMSDGTSGEGGTAPDEPPAPGAAESPDGAAETKAPRGKPKKAAATPRAAQPAGSRAAGGPTAKAPRPAKKAPPRTAVARTRGAETAAVAIAASLADDERPPRLAAWPDRAVAASAALVATDVLLLVGVLITGLVASGKQGSAAARLGAAFYDDVGTGHALLLVVAAAFLACGAWAARAAGAGPRLQPGAERPAKRAATFLLLVALVIFIATPLAAWGYLAYLHHAKQAVDGVVRAQLATWMAVTMVPDGVAGVVAWWVVSLPA